MANVNVWGKDLSDGQMRPAEPGDTLTVAGGTPIPGLVDQRQEVFTPTLGQTLFTLAATPLDSTDVQVFVNSIKYINTVDFTVSGNQVTWGDVEFTLDNQDKVEIVYFV